MHNIPSIRTLLLIGVASLQGCGWVDSTGNQAAENPSDGGISVPVSEFESSIKLLRDGQATALLENTTSRTQLEGVGRSTRGWNWELVDEGDHQACNDVGGFDSIYAADSLEDACTVQSECDLNIGQAEDTETPEFNFTLPRLSSAVALTYSVSSEQDDGTLSTRSQVICALAVNEAPNAGNDAFRALAGVQRTVQAQDANNLLDNDVDDEDVRNQPLRIDTRVVIAPRYAENFSLQSNGGFTYKAASDTPLDSNGERTDSFVYSVSDGLHAVNATVTLSIVASNINPLPIGTLPDALITQSSIDAGTVYEIDTSDYFIDLDNDPLYYSIDTDELPQGLSISIDEGGLLAIDIDANEPVPSSGEWQITVLATDGLASASTDFQLELSGITAQGNRPPTVSDISNRFVQNTFQYDVSVFFDDPDGDELSFTSENLPPNVTLSASGVLSGRSSNRNFGAWIIVIKATDEFGESVSDGFRLVIN